MELALRSRAPDAQTRSLSVAQTEDNREREGSHRDSHRHLGIEAGSHGSSGLRPGSPLQGAQGNSVK